MVYRNFEHVIERRYTVFYLYYVSQLNNIIIQFFNMSIKFPIQMYDPSRDYALHKEELDVARQVVVDSGAFINGPQVKELETKLSEYTGTRAITCKNGTDALFVALKALDIGPGDEVITVAFTWISSANVISLAGATPVWCDIKEDSFCIDENLIESLITPKTKAIIGVSLYGNMPDYKLIQEIAQKHNIFVIEDGAQSFGSIRDGNLSCSCQYTDIATTSFFPTKPLGGFGDGGCIFTRNEELGNKIRAIKNHGGTVRFKHKYIGLNSRLDTMNASVILEKLKYFDDTLPLRDNCAQAYNERLKDYLITPTYKMDRCAWAQYGLICSSIEQRDFLVSELKKKQVNVVIFYPIALYNQECFSNTNNTPLPVTEKVCGRVLNLPCYCYVTDDEISYITETIKEILV